MALQSRSILLLGSDEEAALAACRSLARAGHQVTSLRVGADPTLADCSRFCSRRIFLGDPQSGVHDFLSALIAHASSSSYDYLLPVGEVACELVAASYETLASNLTILGPAPQSYATARDAKAVLDLADALGVDRPPASVASEQGWPSEVALPCLVKPVVTCSIVDDEPQLFTARTVSSTEALDAKLRDDLPRGDVLLMRPPNGRRIDLSLCTFKGSVLGAFATASVAHGAVRTVSPARSEVMDIGQSFVRTLNWTGFITLQLFKVEGSWGICGLSARPGAELASASAAGLELAQLLLDAFEGRRITTVAGPPRSMLTRNFRRSIKLSVGRLQRDSAIQAIASVSRALCRLLAGQERLETERFNDPIPALLQFAPTFRQLRVRFLRRFNSRSRIQPDGLCLTWASRLLIVCKGNINRSPVAELLLRANGFVNVRSAGLLPITGRRTSARAEQFLNERGLAASRFRSRSIERALREGGELDAVVCFEEAQAEELARRFPKLDGKIILLSDLAAPGGRGSDIADPHGARAEIYEACFRRIEDIIEHFACDCRIIENANQK